MTEWQDIKSAPKDGTVIRAKRVYQGDLVFEGRASWRTVRFSAIDTPWQQEPAYDAEGWMRADTDHRFPVPTHWMPL